VTYNYLNLPLKVTLSTGFIDYVYDASGVKQRKTISTGGSTDYAGSFVYENNALKQFAQPEGYVVYNSGVFNYIYQYKDHLGNIRLSYQDKDNNGVVNNTEIVQESNYYPFGLTQKGYNGVVNGVDNKYKYNGKELQDELGLGMYDYGWRNYDSALGRWMNIDNLAEKYVSASPYHYAGNNPVLNLDVDGNEFTESAWRWVNRLIADINSRQEKNNRSIADYQSKISNGGSDRQIARWNRNINSLTTNNAELETTRGETATLAASSQVYNVIEDSNGTQSDAIGNTSTTNSTSFNFANGNIDISVSSGTSLGLFAHELKHAFQFETGIYSIGPALSRVPYTNLFYDKNDEVEAYQRGALFGDRNNYSANNLPAEYSEIPTGPYNFNNVQPTSSRIGSPNQQQDLQNIANRIGHAFRIDGRTYYKRR
ncbi:RHS repeat-associated core domain-containing protein, partial [Flavobacterium sp. MC2016-06]|uniref:RHS repeat protein n=1 Tax=Flavobacterium sp. MC2016-06 TaxID=2676308 RepID=UPI0031E00ECF